MKPSKALMTTSGEAYVPASGHSGEQGISAFAARQLARRIKAGWIDDQPRVAKETRRIVLNAKTAELASVTRIGKIGHDN